MRLLSGQIKYFKDGTQTEKNVEKADCSVKNSANPSKLTFKEILKGKKSL